VEDLARASERESNQEMKEVVVYSKEGCCLCEEALKVLRKVQASCPFILREVNIVEDRNLLEKFKEEIPVVYIDSRKAFKYRVEERKFIDQLTRGVNQK